MARKSRRPLVFVAVAVGMMTTSLGLPVRSQAPPAKVPASYDVASYVTHPGDQTFADISREIYQNEQYGKALVLFNRDHPLSSDIMKQDPPQLRPGTRIYFPPIDVLKSKYPNAIARSSSKEPSSGDSAPKTKSLPVVQHVNKRHVAIEYEVSRIGPSGIGGADLWWTRDNGRTWTKAPTPALPDPVQQGRFRRAAVLLEGDGLYGFRIIARSRTGLAKKPPRAGDAPEWRIELDTVPPGVCLFKPTDIAPDIVLLSWKADDKNLARCPITLEWSEKRTGPWQSIAREVANTGRYTWTLSPAIPVEVHLRIRVRDLAGNEGVAVTPEPLVLDFVEPEARIVGASALRD